MTSPAPSPVPNLDRALRAVAEPHRRAILALVRERPRAVGEIAEHLPLTQQSVSRHLRTLREAGLLTERREGTRHLFVVAPRGFSVVTEFLEQFWPTQLAALKRAAEATAAGIDTTPASNTGGSGRG